MHVSFPVNREWIRFIEQPDGSVVLQVTGYITQTFSTDDGASVTVNVSGPGKPIQYPNNDFELRAWGLSSLILTEEQAAELGTPQIALVKGPLDVIFHEDGSVTPIRIPNVINDLCAELGA